MRISVAIPVYEAGGVGHIIITHALKSLYYQTFKDFEVIVSDQSVNDLVQKVCEEWKERLNIVYTREENKRGYFTANENNAIRHCSGEIIKFLDADDFLIDKHALQVVSDAFDENTFWLATDYMHTKDRVGLFKRHHPEMNDRIYIVNTIGTPSCIAVRNMRENNVYFDENLRWAGDCEYYKQLYDRFGNPKIIYDLTAVHLLWDGTVEKTVFADKEKQDAETAYIINKYEGIK